MVALDAAAKKEGGAPSKLAKGPIGGLGFKGQGAPPLSSFPPPPQLQPANGASGGVPQP